MDLPKFVLGQDDDGGSFTWHQVNGAADTKIPGGKVLTTKCGARYGGRGRDSITGHKNCKSCFG